MAADAVQCGFCTPGMIMAAAALLERNPRPSRGEIERWLGSNLCRCTGYQGIVDAIEWVANGQAGSPRQWPSAPEGTSWAPAAAGHLRADALEKATGSAVYAADLAVDGMLHARVLRSPHRARGDPRHRHGPRAPAAGRRGDPDRAGRPGREQLRSQAEGPARPGRIQGPPGRRSRRPRGGDIAGGGGRGALGDRGGVPPASRRVDPRRRAGGRRTTDPPRRQPAGRELAADRRRRGRVRPGRRRGGAHLHDPVERARLPGARGRAGLLGGRHARRADGDAVLPLPAGRDREDAGPAGRARSRRPHGRRGRLRRQDRDLVPVPGGAGHRADGPAGPDRLQPGRVLRVDHEAPPLPDPVPERRHARRQAHRPPGRHARRHRRVRLVRPRAHGQDVRLGDRSLPLAERRAARPGGVHEQPHGRLHARPGDDAGRVRRRVADGPPGRAAGHGSPRAPLEEPPPAGRPAPVGPGPRARPGLRRDDRGRPAALARGAGALRRSRATGRAPGDAGWGWPRSGTASAAEAAARFPARTLPSRSGGARGAPRWISCRTGRSRCGPAPWTSARGPPPPWA